MLAFISGPSHKAGLRLLCSRKSLFMELGLRAFRLHLHHSTPLHRSGWAAGPRGWSTLMCLSCWWCSHILGVSGPLDSQGCTGSCFWLAVEVISPAFPVRRDGQEFRQELLLLAWAPENVERKVSQYQPWSRSKERI